MKDLLTLTLARTAPVLRVTLQVVGAATLSSLALFGITIGLSERETGRRDARASISVSPVAEQIATKLAPSLQSLATENKEGVVAASGGAVARLAVRTIYPAGVQAIPYATRIGCDHALSYLDGLSVAELVGMMTEHARAKGQTHLLHPSVARQAGIR